MSDKRYLMGAALLAAAWMGASAAEAACKQGFCMSGYYDGKARWVDFTASRNFTHFNLYNGRRQIELGSNQRSFPLDPVGARDGKLTYKYRIQGCIRGGILAKSSCGPWVNFSHTDKN